MAARGKKVPALENWEEPYEDLEWAWDGWWWMHGRRRVDNGGVRLLTAEEMNAYCTLFDLDDDQRHEAARNYWPSMDLVYLEYYEKTKPTTGSSPPPPPARRR